MKYTVFGIAALLCMVAGLLAGPVNGHWPQATYHMLGAVVMALFMIDEKLP